MTESPLETARRVWPGEWKTAFGFIHLPLSEGPLLPASVAAFEISGRWRVMLNTRGQGEQIASGPDLAEALTRARQQIALAVAELARAVSAPDVGAAVAADPCPWCGPGSAMVAETVLRDGCADGEPGAWGCSIRCRGCSGEGPWGKGHDRATAVRSAISTWNRRCDPSGRLTSIADLTRERDEAQAETAEVQDAVRNTILDIIGAEHSNQIDGAGSDAGPVEFTVMEVRQGFEVMQERLDEALALAEERRVRLMLAKLETCPDGWVMGSSNGWSGPGLWWLFGNFAGWVSCDIHHSDGAQCYVASARITSPPAYRAVEYTTATEAWTHAQALRSFIEEHGALPPSESAKDTP